MIRCAHVFTKVYGHDTCLRVCVCVGGGVSCVCVWASVYVCICHSREVSDRKKIFFASKDKNKVLKS